MPVLKQASGRKEAKNLYPSGIATGCSTTARSTYGMALDPTKETMMKENELLDREELIEDFLESYEEELRQQPDDDLIGEARLEELRRQQIEELTEAYSEQLEEMDNESLLGPDALDHI